MQKRMVFLILAVTFLGGGGQAAGFEAEFIGSITEGLSGPTSLVVGEDYLAVLEPFADRLTLFTADGQISQRVALAGDARGLARLDETHYLYCDRRQNKIMIVDLAQNEQTVFLSQADPLFKPVDLIVDESNCYILDAGRGEILVTDHSGQQQRSIPLTVPANSPLGFPASFTSDQVRNLFYVFDQTNSRVSVFNQRGEFTGSFCSFGAGAGMITRGGEIVCDAAGYLYITDRYQGRVAVFNPRREFVTFLDPGVAGGNSLNVPAGIAVDHQGVLYVASTEGHRIDLYHLEKGEKPAGSLTASPAYPINYDTVSIGDVRLVAGLNNPGDQSAMDFQLIRQAEMTLPIDEVFDIPVTDNISENPDGQSFFAVWYPEVSLRPGAVYGWRVRVQQAASSGDWSEWQWFATAAVPADYHLEQNYPNPFNPQTTISFVNATGGQAVLAVYDLLGREVWQRSWSDLAPGRHQVVWNSTDESGNPVASGIYFYRLTAGGFTKTKKMVLLK